MHWQMHWGGRESQRRAPGRNPAWSTQYSIFWADLIWHWKSTLEYLRLVFVSSSSSPFLRERVELTPLQTSLSLVSSNQRLPWESELVKSWFFWVTVLLWKFGESKEVMLRYDCSWLQDMSRICSTQIWRHLFSPNGLNWSLASLVPLASRFPGGR